MKRRTVEEVKALFDHLPYVTVYDVMEEFNLSKRRSNDWMLRLKEEGWAYIWDWVHVSGDMGPRTPAYKKKTLPSHQNKRRKALTLSEKNKAWRARRKAEVNAAAPSAKRRTDPMLNLVTSLARATGWTRPPGSGILRTDIDG